MRTTLIVIAIVAVMMGTLVPVGGAELNNNTPPTVPAPEKFAKMAEFLSVAQVKVDQAHTHFLSTPDWLRLLEEAKENPNASGLTIKCRLAAGQSQDFEAFVPWSEDSEALFSAMTVAHEGAHLAEFQKGTQADANAEARGFQAGYKVFLANVGKDKVKQLKKGVGKLADFGQLPGGVGLSFVRPNDRAAEFLLSELGVVGRDVRMMVAAKNLITVMMNDSFKLPIIIASGSGYRGLVASR